MPQQLSILAPTWSKPQWAAIGKSADLQSTSLHMRWAPAEEIAAVFAELRDAGSPPDVALLPTKNAEAKPIEAFRVLHEIANQLDEEGLVLSEDEVGIATGVVPLWAHSWTLHVTTLDADVRALVIAAGRYREPKFPVAPISKMSFLFHEQTFKLPASLGGIEFSVHFPGTMDVEIETDVLDPGRGTIRVLRLEGKLPTSVLDFLPTLPWTQAPTFGEGNAFSMHLLETEDAATNAGTIDFQTGETNFALAVRVGAPFLKLVGMASLDLMIEEKGRWDAAVGTLYLAAGTVTLVNGLFAGSKIILLSASKNQRQTIRTACTAQWEALEVEVLQYGTSPASAPDLDRLRSLFGRLSGSAGRLAHLIAAAISVTQARSVFVTYVCVITETFQDQQMKDGQWQNVGNPWTRETVQSAQCVELPDRDALLWWQGLNPPRREVQAAVSRNRPTTGCDCPP